MKKKEYEILKEKIETIIEDLTKNDIIRKDRNYKDFEYILLSKEDFDNLRYELLNHKWNTTKTLYQCYDRASRTKTEIYEDYKKKLTLLLASLNLAIF